MFLFKIINCHSRRTPTIIFFNIICKKFWLSQNFYSQWCKYAHELLPPPPLRIQMMLPRLETWINRKQIFATIKWWIIVCFWNGTYVNLLLKSSQTTNLILFNILKNSYFSNKFTYRLFFFKQRWFPHTTCLIILSV